MSYKFWLIRFSIVFVAAFIVIAGAQYLKSQNTIFALTQAVIWAPVAAAVYLSVLVYKFRRNPLCFIRDNKPKS